jgi:hypothetical protein
MEALMRIAGVVLAALVIASCGDPIVDTTYRGEPIWTVEGTISAPEQLDGLSLGDEVRASLFWIPNLSAQEQLLFVEQTSVTAEVRFPATFEVRVFEPPTLDHFNQFDSRYATALLLIYVDEERDGFYSGTDRVVGGTLNKVLVFAREAVPLEDSLTNAEIPIGFSLLQPPFKCPNSAGPGREFDSPIPDRFGYCEMQQCPDDSKCNLWGWCEPDYPLTIQVTELIPKDVFCPPL